MIKLNGIDLVKFVQKVYELSVPQGLGFMHARPGGLSEEDAKGYINEKSSCVISMDYVKGRACKMGVFKQGDDLTMNDNWYDHTNEQLSELLSTFGIKLEVEAEHNRCCNCAKCRGR